MFMKTHTVKKSEIQERWYVLDASDRPLGRLACEVAMALRGKHRPEYTPHCDCGDYVVVTNAEKVKLSGRKMDVRHYTWYTGYPRLRLESYGDRLERRPEDLIYHAVRRMLPKNKLASKMLARLKIFPGAERPHQAQQPQPRTVGAK